MERMLIFDMTRRQGRAKLRRHAAGSTGPAFHRRGSSAVKTVFGPTPNAVRETAMTPARNRHLWRQGEGDLAVQFERRRESVSQPARFPEASHPRHRNASVTRALGEGRRPVALLKSLLSVYCVINRFICLCLEMCCALLASLRRGELYRQTSRIWPIKSTKRDGEVPTLNMSTTHVGSPAPNQSDLSTATYGNTDPSGAEKQIRLLLFGLCVTIAAATFVGGVYSLLSLLRMRRKTSLCLIVASMSVDDLLSVVPLSLFMLLQWETDGGGGSGSLCTLSGLLYVFQGVSSNMKACLIAAYTFYVTKRFGVLQSVRRPIIVMWAIAGVWAVSLTVSVLPVCGWGSFTPASLGCFPESDSVYIVLLFSLYTLCFCGLLFFFTPLTYQLLCSREPQRTLLYPSYLEMARGLSGSAPLCELQSFSRDSLNKCFGDYKELSPSSCGTQLREKEDTCLSPVSVSEQRAAAVGDTPVVFAQKRFSMILAVVRVVLWMPMMVSKHDKTNATVGLNPKHSGLTFKDALSNTWILFWRHLCTLVVC